MVCEVWSRAARCLRVNIHVATQNRCIILEHIIFFSYICMKKIFIDNELNLIVFLGLPSDFQEPYWIPGISENRNFANPPRHPCDNFCEYWKITLGWQINREFIIIILTLTLSDNFD